MKVPVESLRLLALTAKDQGSDPQNCISTYWKRCKAKPITDDYFFMIIAKGLSISEHIVVSHVKNMFGKVAATNKVKLVGRLFR